MAAIEISHEVAAFLNFVGVPYPDIDEDQVRMLADHVRTFAADLAGTHDAANTAVKDLGTVYSGYSYQQLVAAWARMNGTHMSELNKACAVVATALRAAAHVITVVKAAVLIELAALAASYATALAASIATSGLSVAIAEAIKQAARHLLTMMEQALIGYVLAEVVGKAIEPLEHLVERMINDALHRGVVDLLDLPATTQTFYIEPDQVLHYAAKLDTYADDILRHAGDFAKRVGGLDFRTGPATLDLPETQPLAPPHTTAHQPSISPSTRGDGPERAPSVTLADTSLRPIGDPTTPHGPKHRELPAPVDSPLIGSVRPIGTQSPGPPGTMNSTVPQSIPPASPAGEKPMSTPLVPSAAGPASVPGVPVGVEPPVVSDPPSRRVSPWQPDRDFGRPAPSHSGSDSATVGVDVLDTGRGRTGEPSVQITALESHSATTDLTGRHITSDAASLPPELESTAETPSAVTQPVTRPGSGSWAATTSRRRADKAAPTSAAVDASTRDAPATEVGPAVGVAARQVGPWSRPGVRASSVRFRPVLPAESATTPWSGSPVAADGDQPRASVSAPGSSRRRPKPSEKPVISIDPARSWGGTATSDVQGPPAAPGR